ncbi:hypothetical protein HXX76_011606 [Chlamydomonas incerta]|uniref:Uncharacterized protein n=1 Tax=Chlamydomonas incerta TaxID=51695 RepID=A0A835VWV0_CHLIN|nr:hypothetical protein HXX76_011606 [Chlamydomonas incerta]|eukprot:KAG2428489.1 hypothetical protein HXX76_011606 [Chlamydomonas incerta]
MPWVTLLLWWSWCITCWVIQSNVTSRIHPTLKSAIIIWIAAAPALIAFLAFTNTWSITNDADVYVQQKLTNAWSWVDASLTI